MNTTYPTRLAPFISLVLLAAVSLTASGCGGGNGSGASRSCPPVDPGFRERQQEYLEFAHSEGGDGGLHVQMARLVLGEPIDESPIRERIDEVLARPDEGDFAAADLTRLLHLSDRHPGLSPELVAEAERALLGFRYWFDDPGQGQTGLTENHQITYMASEYLMAQRLPDAVFGESGFTGRERMDRVRPRLLRWLNDRARFGYSEWLSTTYYGVDIRPLVTLVDFAEDPEIRERAAIAMDLLVYDLALNSFESRLGSTKGRANSQVTDLSGGIATTPMAILFGGGSYRGPNESAGTAVATSEYGIPRVLAEIARDPGPFVTRQRNGVDIEEGPTYGIGFETDEDAAFWYAMGGWSQPNVIQLTVRLAEQYGVVPAGEGQVLRPFFEVLGILPDDLLNRLSAIPQPITAGSMYDRSDIITYRSPHGTLSSNQDQMKGIVGFAQHAWQATLGQRALVYTTHPGPFDQDSPIDIGGNLWNGGSSMPRVGQHHNVAIVLYDPVMESLFGGLLADLFPDFTHAYFPRAEFDEVVSEGHWSLARKGDGYVALYSHATPTWTTEGEFADREITAPGGTNVWICELGNAAESGSFARFVDGVLGAAIEVVDGTEVRYGSPSRGLITFGWDAQLVVDGVEQALGPHPRYDNPFSEVPWGARRLEIRRGEVSLTLDLDAGTRGGT